MARDMDQLRSATMDSGAIVDWLPDGSIQVELDGQIEVVGDAWAASEVISQIVDKRDERLAREAMLSASIIDEGAEWTRYCREHRYAAV